MSFDPPRETDPPRHTWKIGPRGSHVPRGLGRLTKVALVTGASVGLALGGAGIAYAASSGTSTTPQPSTGAPNASPGGHARHPGRHATGGFGALGGRVLHGQATVRTPGGVDKTVEMQAGTASGVSATSITVKSSDGYSHTYTVTAATVVDSQAGGISTVAGGDTVRVIATPENGQDTATSIVDATKIRSSRAGFGFAPPASPAAGAGPSTTP